MVNAGLVASVGQRRRGFAYAAVAQTLTGLDYPSNNQANADIRLLFALSRFNSTIIWKKRHRQQTGYPASWWFEPLTRSWDGGAHSVGFHGHPCDGTFQTDGQRSNGTGSGGTVHYEEIAGLLLASDYIASPASPGPQSTFLLVDGAWRNQCAVITPVSTSTQHTYYPDLANRPTQFIRQSVTTSAIDAGTSAGGPYCYLGASSWTPSGNSNTECPSGIYRGIQQYEPALTNKTHIDALSAMETDAQVLAYCSANGITTLKYLNMNPTPSDVTNKGGSGPNPAWDNARRPTLYTA